MPAYPLGLALALALATLALAACSPDTARDPLGPSVQNLAVELPFRGSFTTLARGEIVPPILTVTGPPRVLRPSSVASPRRP
jgi:hypothetical protein